MDRPRGDGPIHCGGRRSVGCYQLLIEPVARAGYLAGPRSLIIVPHAELHFLPFAALIAPGAPEQYLV